MTMFRILSPALLLCASLSAQSIIPPSNLFRDPSFVREFVGSYGIHSEVEPKVSSAESTLLAKVSELFAASKFKEAEAEITRYIKETTAPTDPALTPGEISPALVFVLGNLYFQANRSEEAERAFKEAIRRFPKFRRAHTNLAYLYVSKERFDDAMPMLQKAIELGENSHRSWGLLGYTHLLRKNAISAENCYRTASVLDPSNKDWQLGLSQALMMQEKFAEASSALDALIRANPNDKQLWLQQTNALLSQEKKIEAALNLETMQLKGMADEANLQLLGNIYMDQSQPQLALQAYSAAIDIAKTLPVAQTLKAARIMNDLGHPEEASDLLQKIRGSSDRMSPEDRVQLGLTDVKIARSQQQLERAGKILQGLVSDAPAHAEVLLETGKHFDLVAREEADEEKRRAAINEAKTHYQLALQQESTAYQANLSYGQMLVRDGRALEALPFIEKALTLKKSDSLEQYTSRVRRAADREKARADREQAERSAAPTKAP
jgi:tetratricopeptide (TPR) repeat protein